MNKLAGEGEPDLSAVIWAWAFAILLFAGVILLGYYLLWPLVDEAFTKDEAVWEYVIAALYVLLFGYLCLWPMRFWLTSALSTSTESELADGEYRNFRIPTISPVTSYFNSDNFD